MAIFNPLSTIKDASHDSLADWPYKLFICRIYIYTTFCGGHVQFILCSSLYKHPHFSYAEDNPFFFVKMSRLLK